MKTQKNVFTDKRSARESEVCARERNKFLSDIHRLTSSPCLERAILFFTCTIVIEIHFVPFYALNNA